MPIFNVKGTIVNTEPLEYTNKFGKKVKIKKSLDVIKGVEGNSRLTIHLNHTKQAGHISNIGNIVQSHIEGNTLKVDKVYIKDDYVKYIKDSEYSLGFSVEMDHCAPDNDIKLVSKDDNLFESRGIITEVALVRDPRHRAKDFALLDSKDAEIISPYAITHTEDSSGGIAVVTLTDMSGDFEVVSDNTKKEVPMNLFKEINSLFKKSVSPDSSTEGATIKDANVDNTATLDNNKADKSASAETLVDANDVDQEGRTFVENFSNFIQEFNALKEDVKGLAITQTALKDSLNNIVSTSDKDTTQDKLVDSSDSELTKNVQKNSMEAFAELKKHLK